MQPIIDIIYEKCEDHIDSYLAANPPLGFYVYRGDPAAHDFEVGDFTQDGGWHELDLSSIIPEFTTAVDLSLEYRSTAVNARVSFRRAGQVNVFNRLTCYPVVANIAQGLKFLLSPGVARKIEYKIDAPIFNRFNLTVSGWFVSGLTEAGFVNRGDPPVHDFLTGDLIKDNAWHDLDLTGIIPANTKSVLLLCDSRANVGARRIRFRTKGNTHVYNISHCRLPHSGLNYAYDITVPTDGLQQIEYNATTAVYPELCLTVKGWWY